MQYRDFMHFAGDFHTAGRPRCRYAIMLSTIVDTTAERTWYAVAIQNKECKGDPGGAYSIYDVHVIVPNVAIPGDDLSDRAVHPRLIDGAVAHSSPAGWQWYQDRTADLKGFGVHLTSQPSGSHIPAGVVGCDSRAGDPSYYQTCCGGWVIFEFSTKGVWSVRDVQWGTISIQTATAVQQCNFIGDASRSASSLTPGTVCTPD